MNMFISTRLACLRARNQFPDQSKVWAFRRALHAEKEQPRQNFCGSANQNQNSATAVSNGASAQGIEERVETNATRSSMELPKQAKEHQDKSGSFASFASQ